MKKYIVEIGPVTAAALGSVIETATAVAALHSVRPIDVAVNAGKPIKRKQIGPAEVRRMKNLRKKGYGTAQIAADLGCSAITVNRHAPAK